MSRGQAAVEAMLIVAVALIILVILFQILQDQSAAKREIEIAQAAEIAITDLEAAGSSVQGQGIGAKTSVNLLLPDEVEKITFTNRTAHIYFRSGHVRDRVLPFIATGTISSNKSNCQGCR